MPDELHQWEMVHTIGPDNEKDIASSTYRMPVPGGWLYRYLYHPDYEGEDMTDVAVIVFVPTP